MFLLYFFEIPIWLLVLIAAVVYNFMDAILGIIGFGFFCLVAIIVFFIVGCIICFLFDYFDFKQAVLWILIICLLCVGVYSCFKYTSSKEIKSEPSMENAMKVDSKKISYKDLTMINYDKSIKFISENRIIAYGETDFKLSCEKNFKKVILRMKPNAASSLKFAVDLNYGDNSSDIRTLYSDWENNDIEKIKEKNTDYTKYIIKIDNVETIRFYFYHFAAIDYIEFYK